MTKLVSFLAFALFLFSACEGGRVLNSQDEEPATLGKVGDDSKKTQSKNPADEDPVKRPLGGASLQRACDLNAGSAVVLMYHRFDEDSYESTSVDVAQFVQHLEFFKARGFKVVRLGDLVKALREGTLPTDEKWVALTIDDAYKSFLKIKPILEERLVPYTIFVNTLAVDRGYSSSMTWQDLRSIVESGLGELAAHSHTHRNLLELESKARKQDILLSLERIYKNTFIKPRLFSYPFGAVSIRLKEEVRGLHKGQAGFEPLLAGFSTQSGAVGCSSDMFALPRFAMNKKYAELNSLFEVKMNSRHLPVLNYFPKNKAICVKDKVDKIGFSTLKGIDLSRISCYSSWGSKLDVKVLGAEVTVFLDQPLGASGLKMTAERVTAERVNCTLPYKGRYFWYGREFFLTNNAEECIKE